MAIAAAGLRKAEDAQRYFQEAGACSFVTLLILLGGAKELGVAYINIIRVAREPVNLGEKHVTCLKYHLTK